MRKLNKRMRAQGKRLSGIVDEKLADAMVPGFTPDFAPEEAELAGAFAERALDEDIAAESQIDLLPPDS